MGRKIVLTGTTLTDNTAPRLVQIDPLESDGSLYLVDCTHPAESWAAGVPTTGATLPNLFGVNLSSLAVGTVDPTITIEGGIGNLTKGKVERSTKNGLHVIVSQANALSLGDGVKLNMPAALEAYLVANASHHYYLSIWDRLTRANGSGGDAIYTVSTTATSTNQGIALGYVSAWGVPSGVTRVNQDILDNTVGPRYADVETDGVVATVTGTRTAGPLWGAPTNGVGSTALTNRNTRWPSFVFYRCYIEDLTVSGRSYATVHALDAALFADLVETPGGRYYGDTFTNPTAIP